MLRASVIGLSVAIVSALPALADKLPKTATPISSEEIASFYSGKSTVWSRSSAYFAPDNSVKGVLGKPEAFTTYKGKWAVSGNEICMNLEALTPGLEVADCWKYWRDGKVVYTLWSRHFDGSKVDEVNGYYKDELSKLKSGDLVSKQYDALLAAQLTGAEIKTTFTGRSTTFRTADGKFTGKAHYKEDGTAIMSKANFPSGADDSGKWRVVDDKFCLNWAKVTSGKEYCVTFVKQADGSVRASNGNTTRFE